MDKDDRWLIGLIIGMTIVFGGLFAHIVFIDIPVDVFKEQYIYPEHDNIFQFKYNEDAILYTFTPSFLVKDYNVSEMIGEKVIIGEWENRKCLKFKDVTKYYITTPIIVTPEALKEYEHMGVACSACEGCSEGNGKVLINYQNNVHYIGYPIIYEKDGRYYIYAESVAEYKNKNDCNIYKEVKMRLYPIYKVDVNTNENCVVYK